MHEDSLDWHDMRCQESWDKPGWDEASKDSTDGCNPLGTAIRRMSCVNCLSLIRDLKAIARLLLTLCRLAHNWMGVFENTHIRREQ